MTPLQKSEELSAQLHQCADLIESTLGHLLSEQTLDHETQRPARLLSAMQLSTLDGGKRLRPFLYMQVAALFGLPTHATAHAACALELIHCYSLVHDDLPAMDDDDMRRGKPTVHIAFDEATAILAGDSLLTLAFDVIARQESHPNPQIRAELMLKLARAAGIGGMAGGQMLDLQAQEHTPSLEEIRQLQAMKTGALLRFACEAGAIHAEACADDVENMRNFGTLLGAAYQLQDDILDVTASAQDMGKATHKDAAAGKGTLVALMGMQEAKAELNHLTQQALDILKPYGDDASILKSLTQYLAERPN